MCVCTSHMLIVACLVTGFPYLSLFLSAISVTSSGTEVVFSLQILLTCLLYHGLLKLLCQNDLAAGHPQPLQQKF